MLTTLSEILWLTGMMMLFLDMGNLKLSSLKLTAIEPENGCLEDDPFLLGWPVFRGELLVSGSVSISKKVTFFVLIVFFPY